MIDHLASQTAMPSRRPIRDRLPRLHRREPLPSLYDRHPRAASGMRRPRGLQIVPLDRIVGTTRHPSQNTADFMPLPYLRGRNWDQRWQRIQSATSDLSVLPAVELVQVGDEYYVADGHNRIAAARRAGAVAIDADVTELILPGVTPSAEGHGARQDAPSLLIGADELRQAAAGRQSRTAEHRSNIDELRRDQLTHDSDMGGEPTDVPPAEPEPDEE